VTDPHSLDLASEVYLTDFLDCWDEWTTRDGKTLPLPKRWRIKVVVLSMAGASDDDWRYGITEAVERQRKQPSQFPNDGLFNYAVGVVWGILATRSGIDQNPRDPVLAAPGKAEQEAERESELQRAAERDAAERARQAAARDALRCTRLSDGGSRCLNTKEPGTEWCARHHPDRICGAPTRYGAPCPHPVSTPGAACQVHDPDRRLCGHTTKTGEPCKQRLWNDEDACRIHRTPHPTGPSVDPSEWAQ